MVLIDMETLSWVSHPARIRRTALIFTATLSTFFFPTKYEISKNKVKIKYLVNKVEKDIKSFRSYYPDKNGVLLSPFPRPSRLENFRGVYVRYHQNKAEVDAFIKKIFEERENES